MFLGEFSLTLLLLGWLTVANFEPLSALPVFNAVANLQSTFACENDILRIRCKHLSVLQISNADFGRRLSNVCPDGNSTKSSSCDMRNYDDLVKKNCNDRQVCSIHASTEIFGDPCPAVRKYMNVIYACVRNPNRLVATSPTTIESASPTNTTPITVPNTQKPTTATNTTKEGVPTSSNDNTNGTNALVTSAISMRKTRGPRKCTTGPTVKGFIPDPLVSSANSLYRGICLTEILSVLLITKLMLAV